jgi:hypothetical protein
MPSLTPLSPADERALCADYPAMGIDVIARRWSIGRERVEDIITAHKAWGRVDALTMRRIARQERNAQMEALWNEGLCPIDISARLGITDDLVRRVLRRAGYVVAYKHKPLLKQLRCRCCEIVLSESGDGGHEAEVVDGLCYDCAARYVWAAGRWQRRADVVLDLVPLQHSSDVQATWAMIEQEV